MVRHTRGLLAACLDLVYPRDCMACGARLTGTEAEPVALRGANVTVASQVSWGRCPACLCDECVRALPRIGPDQCPSCGDALGPFARGAEACPSCRRGQALFFSGTVTVYRYEGAAREIVHRLKYARDLRAITWMAHEVTAKLKQTDWFGRVDMLVPVPLHWARRLARRFNQSELLGRRISRESGKPLVPSVLRRSRKTASQTALSPSQREENVRGAFRVIRPERISGKVILLVDDVMTTCATAAECSRTLVKAGARRVYVAVFAR